MKLCLHPKKITDEGRRKLAQKKNATMGKAFAATAFGDRVIFVPHCMRSVDKCAAKEMGSYYLCRECGNCKIADISKKSKELGYKALFILKGGRAVEKLINENKPQSVLGVACYFEGIQGMEQAEKGDIVVQFVPLSKDGCVNTDVELEEVFKVLEKKT